MSTIDDYKIGMTVYGKITGVKPYGAFVSFDNEVTGLIHISELSNGFVKDVSSFVKPDDYVMLKVIDIDKIHKQLRLSFKALAQNNRRYMRRVKYCGMANHDKGFDSIREKMPQWLEEAKNAKG